MPERAINGDILTYVPKKIEPEVKVYITILCEYNLRGARVRGKEKWRREAGRKKSRRWTTELATALQQRVLTAQSHMMFPYRTWETIAFGNRGRENNGAPGPYQSKVTAGNRNSPILLNHAACLPRQLPAKPDPLTAVALSMHEPSQ